MGVVFRPKPRSSFADIHVECPRCARDGLLQCFLRFRCAPKLTQRRRGPAVDHRKIGIRPDQPFRCRDRTRRRWPLAQRAAHFWDKLGPQLVFNLVFFAGLAAADVWWAYPLLWLLPLLTWMM